MLAVYCDKMREKSVTLTRGRKTKLMWEQCRPLPELQQNENSVTFACCGRNMQVRGTLQAIYGNNERKAFLNIYKILKMKNDYKHNDEPTGKNKWNP